MLAVAKTKGIYKNFVCETLGSQRTNIEDGKLYIRFTCSFLRYIISNLNRNKTRTCSTFEEDFCEIKSMKNVTSFEIRKPLLR